MTQGRKHKPDALFVLSIDTEEEWNWDGAFPEQDCAVKNIQLLPEFHEFCIQLGLRPSYFVDYPVVNDPHAGQILAKISEQDNSEIGAHLHPWCNPPYFGQTGERESHVVNLPLSQVEAKLDCLISKIAQSLGVVPRAFRSGRWGINSEVLELLVRKGFNVDSSVYPYYQNQYFSCLGAPSTPYWPSMSDVNRPGHQRQIYELPVTAGYNRRNWELSDKLHNALANPRWHGFRPVGVMWHSRLLKKLYLSPELSSSDELLQLMQAGLRRQQRVFHMYIHSSSLLDGATGFMKHEQPYQYITQAIARSVAFLQEHCHVRFCTISEAANLHQLSVDFEEQYRA